MLLLANVFFFFAAAALVARSFFRLMWHVLFWLAFVSSAYFRHSNKQKKTVKLQFHISYKMARKEKERVSSRVYSLTPLTSDMGKTIQSDSKNLSDVNSNTCRCTCTFRLECRRCGGACGSAKYRVENTKTFFFF